MQNIVVIALKDGKTVGSANAEDLDEVRSIAHLWLREEIADVVRYHVQGQHPREIYS